jgi:hypothetical protein
MGTEWRTTDIGMGWRMLPASEKSHFVGREVDDCVGSLDFLGLF